MDEQQNEQLILTAEERVACERVAAGEAPHGQRALAILALADGATLSEAASKSGLTENQVKLWRGRFRNGRLAIFPEELIVTAETAVAPPLEKKDKKEKKKNKDGSKKKKDKKGKKKKKEKKGKKKSKKAKKK